MDNKTIKAGIVGYGLSGKVFHAPFIHTHPGFQLCKIVERHQSLSKYDYPYAEVVKDFGGLIADPEIELVAVCTPNTLHYPMVKACLDAGKHVVIEKPFTNTTKEADELIHLANTKNLKIFAYQNRRWDGDFLTIKKILENNLLGEVTEYEAHFDRYRPDPVKERAWREEDTPGSGILYDLGSHLIDQALQLFGIPERVFADIRCQRVFSDVDDFFELNLHYPLLKVILTAGMLVKTQGPRFILHGTKGTYIKYGIDPQEDDLKNGLLPGNEDWGADSPANWGFITMDCNGLQIDGRIQTENGAYELFYDNIYDVLTIDAEMAVKPYEARNVIRTIELAFESSRTKTTLDYTENKPN